MAWRERADLRERGLHITSRLGHRVRLYPSDRTNVYYARCNCGWQSRNYSQQSKAVDAGKSHAEKI